MGSSVKIEELDKKIEQELDQDNPDIGQIKAWRQEIRELQNPKPEEPEPEPEPAPEPPAKKETSYGGLNAILYIGSLLIIAGAGSLLATAVSDFYKMMILFFIVILFYGGGLAIRSNDKLKSAGNAFVGTALAIIPFLGFAFAGLTRLPGEISWLLTSAVGVSAYVVAALIMNNKVIAYFSMAFLISLVCSAPACFHLHVIWCFFMIMLLGIIVNLVALSTKDDKANVFSGVLNVSGRWLPALTSIMSLCVITITEPWFYTLLFGLSTLNFFLIWISERTKTDEVLLRFSAQIFVLALVYSIFNQDENATLIFGFAIGATCFIHAMISVFIGYTNKKYVYTETAIIAPLLATAIAVSLPIMYSAVTINTSKALSNCHYEPGIYTNHCNFSLDLYPVVHTITLIWVALIAVISLLARKMHNKKGWVFGLIPALLFVPPLIIAGPIEMLSTEAIKNLNLVYFFLYIAEFLVVAGWALLSRTKDLMLEIFSLVITTILGLIMMGCGASYHTCLGIVSMLLIAIFWVGLGAKNNRNGVIEAGAYIGASALCYFINWVSYDYLQPEKIIENASSFVSALSLHIFAATLIGIDLWRKQGHRKKIALIALPILMSFIAASSFSTNGLPGIWVIVALLEDIAILYYGYLRRHQYVWNAIAAPLAIVATSLVSQIAASSCSSLRCALDVGVISSAVFIHTISGVLLLSSYLFKERATRIVAVCLISALMGMTVVAASSGWQLLYLVEEVIIFAISGAVVKDKAIQIISGIFVVLAIMRFTAGYLFIWLILLGFGLIGLVIHKLLKKE